MMLSKIQMEFLNRTTVLVSIKHTIPRMIPPKMMLYNLYWIPALLNIRRTVMPPSNLIKSLHWAPFLVSFRHTTLVMTLPWVRNLKIYNRARLAFHREIKFILDRKVRLILQMSLIKDFSKLNNRRVKIRHLIWRAIQV